MEAADRLSHGIRIAYPVLWFGCVFACGPAMPRGRFATTSVEVRGMEHLDEAAARACLGTRRPVTIGFDLGASSDLNCGVPPFDQGRIPVRVDSPFSTAPVFDPGVFREDGARLERWLRARGHYGGRVEEAVVTPESALTDTTCDTPPCGVAIEFRVSEGPPVLVSRVEIRGLDDLPRSVRQSLRGVLAVERGQVFDEADYETTKTAFLRILGNMGYPQATVRGEVKIDTEDLDVFVVFNVEHGPPGVFGRLCVEGYGSLPPRTLLASTLLQPGETFSLARIEDAQQAVYGLGTVASVEIQPIDEQIEAAENRVCTDGPRHPVPEGTRVVNLLLRVREGRLERFGFGIGAQIGDTLAIAANPSSALGQSLAMWDVHLLLAMEWRNLFSDMLRVRLEERPRWIFPRPFPGGAEESRPGNQIAITARWPAFAEPRTALVGGLQHDYGVVPFYNFFRHELDGRLGFERAFLEGRLALSLALRGSLYIPDRVQGVMPEFARPETNAAFIEEGVVLDLRNNPRDATDGFFASINLQQGGIAGLSSWDYLRAAGDVRGYVPVGLGVVIAGRFGLGIMEVLGTHGLDPNNVYALSVLGPVSQHLVGGGAASNRGFPPGYLGDAELVPVISTAGEVVDQILLSGGNRRWEASLEIRIPVTENGRIVLFADAGDVSRPSAQHGSEFRFSHLQLALGVGLRYRTIVGPIRVDFALRPRDLQVIGQDTRPPECGSGGPADRCRPDPVLFSDRNLPGAIHVTIGEAF